MLKDILSTEQMLLITAESNKIFEPMGMLSMVVVGLTFDHIMTNLRSFDKEQIQVILLAHAIHLEAQIGGFEKIEDFEESLKTKLQH